jgi:hypothetical protein
MGELPAGFKIIPGFEAYAVNDCGVVMRVTSSGPGKAGKILRQRLCVDGYPEVQLWRGKNCRRKVHRLMALAHLGLPPAGKNEVAHGNGIRTDNRIANLRWASAAENCRDKLLHGFWQPARGEEHHGAKLTDDAVRDIRKRIGWGELGRELAVDYLVSETAVSRVRLGRNWKHVDCPDEAVDLTGFAPIPGFESYSVSRCGRVVRVVGGRGTRAGREIRPVPNMRGVLVFNARSDGRSFTMSVKKAIAMAFPAFEPSPKINVVNHAAV